MAKAKEEETKQVAGHPEVAHGKDDSKKEGEELKEGESKPGHPEVKH